MHSSSQDSRTGKLVSLFSCRNRLSQETFSDRDYLPQKHQPAFGSNEPFTRFSDSAKPTKTLHNENSDFLLAEARADITRQECKMESLNKCIREFQLQIQTQHLKWKN